jgi:hypothetical protein
MGLTGVIYADLYVNSRELTPAFDAKCESGQTNEGLGRHSKGMARNLRKQERGLT